MNILMTMVWSDAAALGRSRLSTCGARGPIRCGQWLPEQNIIAALRPVQGKQNKGSGDDKKDVRQMRSQDLDWVQPGRFPVRIDRPRAVRLSCFCRRAWIYLRFSGSQPFNYITDGS